MFKVQVSVEELATFLGATVARQLVAGILNGELVVICELLSTVDAARGKYDNMLLPVDCDDSGVAVGLAGVVDEASSVAMDCSIYNLIVINTKHVTANPL